ncbi:MAG: hypothetical protein IT564_08365 [Rhodospirillales bacterium]|nr:hypothetical protein [Rhodospirillales bacterium]
MTAWILLYIRSAAFKKIGNEAPIVFEPGGGSRSVMDDSENIRQVLAEHLTSPMSAFSIGSLGAIAEYVRDTGEATRGSPDGLCLATPRGAIRLKLLDGIVPLAFETVSARPGCWQQGVLFCLPVEAGTSRGRAVVTPLGPDREAIDPADREAELFDLGLGAVNVDFCVRVSDPSLVRLLHRSAEHSILDPGNPLMGALIDASPPRVVLSALGRIEVYQAIDRMKSPGGPHTHVLPKLLRTKRTHSANICVPAGLVPCLSLHPPSPLFDLMGRPKPFDAAAHRAFQKLLEWWGDKEYRGEKARATAAIVRGAGPASYRKPATRVGRSAMRIALRQRLHVAPEDEAVRRWSEHFEGGSAMAYRR